MGTYRKGEIAELCEFVPPDIAVITSIGPVHLERFGSEEAIVEAKREILAKARRRDSQRRPSLLADLADQEEGRLKVIRISGLDGAADVSVIDGMLMIDGQPFGAVRPDVLGSNLGRGDGGRVAMRYQPGGDSSTSPDPAHYSPSTRAGNFGAWLCHHR